MTTIDQLVSDLRLPVVAAPMTGVSTPSLVGEACRAGVVGSFPTSNPRSSAELDEWFDEIETIAATSDRTPGPIAANLIVGKQNTRLDDDVECVSRRKPPIVITSVGSPVAVIPALHDAGCLVFADVAAERHAVKALEAGADGLVLLAAGAGGHTGWANPFAFIRAVRTFFDGPLIMAGGIADGASIWAAQCAGYAMSLAGTRFIATEESGASESWQDALVSSSMDDVSVATAPNGVAASVLPDGAGSAGHTVSVVSKRQTVAELVDELESDWLAAKARTSELLNG